MFFILILEACVVLTLWRWLKGRSTQSKLKSWTEDSVPVFSSLMEKASGGAPTSRAKMVAANAFKIAARKYVNSGLFDHAVYAMINNESLLHSLAHRISDRFRKDQDLFQ